MPGPVNPLAPGVQVTNNGLEIADGTNVRATLGKLPDGTYGLLIYNGAIELIDQFGQTIMSNGAFTGPMIDYIQSGVYNNMFVAGTPGVLPMGTSRDDATGHTSALPGWTVWRSSGSGTATLTTDLVWPGGNYVEFDFTAVGTSTTNNVALTSDLVPVRPGNSITLETVAATNIPGGVTLNPSVAVRFYTAAGTFISGATTNPSYTISFAARTLDSPLWSVPLNARFARYELICWETVAHAAATYYRHGSTITSQMPVNQSVLGNLGVAGGATITGYVSTYGTTYTYGAVEVLSALYADGALYQIR